MDVIRYQLYVTGNNNTWKEVDSYFLTRSIVS